MLPSTVQFPKIRPAHLWVLFCIALCVSGSPLFAQGAETDAAAESSAAETDAASADDDTEWLVNDAGRKYRVAEIPRIEGTFRVLDEGARVRLPGGAILELVRMTEDTIYVRDYKPLEVRPPAVSVPNPASRERLQGEELDALLAEYDIQLDQADELVFEPFDDGLPRGGQWRNAFALADMNADGHLDIVFGPARKGRARPNIFLGDGQGGWTAWNVSWPAAPYDYGAVTVGDLDGDDLPDLVFGIHLRGVLALRNEGEGRFALWSEGIEVDHPGRGGDGTSFSSRRVSIRDWNGDDRLDIVVLGEGPKGLKTRARRGASRMIDTSRGVLVYLNQGDGTWVVSEQEEGARLNFGDDFAFLDLDGEGPIDLVLASQQMGVHKVLGVRTDAGIERQLLAGMRPSALVDSVEVLDLDDDGRDDFVLSYRSRDRGQWFTGIDRFVRKEGGGWHREALYGQPNHHGFYALRSGDINGDGRADLLAADGDGQIRVFVGTEKGFQAEESPELPEFQRGCIGYDLRLADLDGDGADEVVASFAGEKTGMPGISRLNNPGCVGEGGIRAWDIVPATAENIVETTAASDASAD